MRKCCWCWRRKALWQGFVRACERVEREASTAGEDPSAAVLDWFGVAVKAAEMALLVSRMKLLARKVRRCSRSRSRSCSPPPHI
jgi:hypothetical protein